MTNTTHTPGPWRWAGEDYRGDWGWQLLVGPDGEGILCGEGPDETPYKHLRGHMPIEPHYCKTGMNGDEDSAPGVHVREADAHLIKAAPDLFDACQTVMAFLQNNTSVDRGTANGLVFARLEAAIAKASPQKL